MTVDVPVATFLADVQESRLYAPARVYFHAPIYFRRLL